MKLPKELADKLAAPLPPEAIKPHPTKKFLSSINSIYVTERLNNVFGIGGWKIKVEVLDAQSDMVTVKVNFTVPEYEIELEQFGGNDNKDKGDALKGATTDALTKIGSYLGIGQDVWKDKGPKVDKSTGEIVEQKPIKKRQGIVLQDGSELVTGVKNGRQWCRQDLPGGGVKWLEVEEYNALKEAYIANAPDVPLSPLPF